MEVHINEAELKLLTYLHENATGYNSSHQFNPTAIMEGLSIDADAFHKQISFLEAFQLAGVEGEPIEAYQTEPSRIITAVYLSGLGENYMRAIEEEPSIARKLTTDVVAKLWVPILIKLAPRLLAEFIKHFHL